MDGSKKSSTPRPSTSRRSTTSSEKGKRTKIKWRSPSKFLQRRSLSLSAEYAKRPLITHNNSPRSALKKGPNRRRSESTKSSTGSGPERAASNSAESLLGITELAKVKHYILRGAINDESWTYHFGTYICKESHRECNLPFLEPKEMGKSLYFQYNKVYSTSLFHMNIHRKCTLKNTITCRLDDCAAAGIAFRKADVFVMHLEKRHQQTYYRLWKKSRFALKPNTTQFLYGMYNVAFNKSEQSVVRWACVVCQSVFNTPNDWQTHRDYKRACSKQVVEVLFNKNDRKGIKKVIKSEQIQYYCALCSKDTDICELKESMTMGSKDAATMKQKTTPSKEGSSRNSGRRPTLVVHGSLKEMMNHICEQHTHKGFICMCCQRVLPITRKKHFVNCLQCTDEGLSMVDLRKYPLSQQTKEWCEYLIGQLVLSDDIEVIIKKEHRGSKSRKTSKDTSDESNDITSNSE